MAITGTPKIKTKRVFNEEFTTAHKELEWLKANVDPELYDRMKTLTRYPEVKKNIW
jgi:hypothetical protein